MKPRIPLFLALGICLVLVEPLLGADLFSGIPDLGLFNFLQPVIRFLGMALLRVIFLIPGGENFLIDVF